jgi:O-methyltransferase involved in polyketide biosynthesis
MNKARLEWVMSGLIQYKLTTAEDHFLKTVCADFDKNQAMTAHQEDRLESLYKEKSRLIPNKKTDPFSLKESSPPKTRSRMSKRKVF